MSPNFALILFALAWNDRAVKIATRNYATAKPVNSMPHENTYFLAGAVVGATVNFIIQSVKMAADYDRKFDSAEFFLSDGAGAFASLAPHFGPRLCRRPAAETWNGETVPYFP